MTQYAELQVTSNFSFLRGASHPEEMALQAAAFGYAAIGIADRNSLAGVVRAHIAAKEAGLRLCVGARLDLSDGISLLAYPTDRAAYGRMSRLITLGRRRAPKGECEIRFADVLEWGAGMTFLAVPPSTVIPAKAGVPEDIGRNLNPSLRRNDDKGFIAQLSALNAAFPGNSYLIANHLLRGDDTARLARLSEIARQCGTPLVAANDVHMHSAARRPLADVVACIREKCTLDDAGFRLAANPEHLKPLEEMACCSATIRTHCPYCGDCRTVPFQFDELRYEYPDEVAPDGRPPQVVLEDLTWEGARRRYPGGVPGGVRKQVEHELQLIGELSYAPYFLTVHDAVRFARENDILCQGRGSAANSAVCYCLGITAVDPSRVDLLFERFVSAERNEPPDVDVDFEHERREVIQYI